MFSDATKIPSHMWSDDDLFSSLNHNEMKKVWGGDTARNNSASGDGGLWSISRSPFPSQLPSSKCFLI